MSQSVKFSLSNLSLAGVLAVGAAVAFGTSVAVAGPDKPCKSTSFVSADTEKACKEGGVPAAQKAMKAAVKGKECKECHEDTKDYSKLKGNAVDDLKKILGK